MNAATGGEPACSHRPPCPACPRFGEPGIARGARESLDALARLHGLPAVARVDGPTAGFRHRARLAIRGRMGSPKLGLFELGTHRVVHIPHCSVQHPLINRVAGVVRRALVETRVPSYSDEAHRGLARYLQVVVERGSQSAQVVMVANSPTADPLFACAELVRERLGADLHSLWINTKCERSNVILGAGFHHHCGPAAVVERFGGAAVHFPPGAFGQNNLGLAQAIIEHVRRQIPLGARTAEFYAGVGAIGLSVLQRVGRLWMNEVGPQSLQGMASGIAGLDAADRARITVLPGPAASALEALDEAEVVIADPPRKGLDPELLDGLSGAPPELFLYVSCGLQSLLADTARLTASGALRLTALTAFNLMPFTEHVETVACFARVHGARMHGAPGSGVPGGDQLPVERDGLIGDG